MAHQTRVKKASSNVAPSSKALLKVTDKHLVIFQIVRSVKQVMILNFLQGVPGPAKGKQRSNGRAKEGGGVPEARVGGEVCVCARACVCS